MVWHLHLRCVSVDGHLFLYQFAQERDNKRNAVLNGVPINVLLWGAGFCFAGCSFYG